MADESSTSQERTEQATPKRLQDARKKGDVARSRELSTAGVMLAGAGVLLALGGPLASRLADAFAGGFRIERQHLFDADFMGVSIARQALDALWLLLPLGAAVVCAAAGFSVILGGATFSAAALKPKLERISIGKGLKRMFGTRSLVELGKSIAKVALTIIVAVLWLRHIRDDLLGLGNMPVAVALAKSGWLALASLAVVSTALIAVAAIDVPWQLFQHAKKLRMTRQEIRDEAKETDGRPEVRQRIRQLQQEVATRRMMDAVPYADVIITNPTHFAVALRYDELRMQAPEVVAKGQDRIAQRIREIAKEHRIGQKIPAGLYTAVAQVLAYIYQLREGGPAARLLVAPVPDVDESLYTRSGRSAR